MEIATMEDWLVKDAYAVYRAHVRKKREWVMQHKGGTVSGNSAKERKSMKEALYIESAEGT